MENASPWKLGQDFKPAPQFKTLYYLYLSIFTIFGVLIWLIPLIIFTSLQLFLVIGTPVILILLFAAFWIGKFYQTIHYRLDEEEVEWHRGVWFKNTGIVPYNRITNVDISQGPISRMLGIGTVKIQTAGYSNPNQGWGNPSEITIEGVVEFEKLRNILISFVRGKKPMAVQTYNDENDGAIDPILSELKEIKELLRKMGR